MARRSTGTARSPLEHLSYSTLSAWFDCPKQVELRKIRKAPATPAWWFAGGSAVHTATENYDRWSLLDPTERGRFSIPLAFATAFEIELAELDQRWPDRSDWRHAGPKTAPETYDRWMKNGPLFVGNYISWRRKMDYVIWQAPGLASLDADQDAVGIEIDLSFTPPGCDREIKAYADRIFFSPVLDQIHIIDLKTGTRGPRYPLQFGTYRAGLQARYGVVAATGAAFMNREGCLGKPFDLSKYTPEYVGKLYGALSRAVDAKAFPAHQGSACRMCDVQDACYTNGGPQSHLYDPDDPECPPY